MEGKVKFFNSKKGFGFIQGDDGKDYFVHQTFLANGVFLRDNDLVSFDPSENEKGPVANNVQLLKKASEMDEADEAPSEEAPAEEEAPADEDSEEEAPAEEAPEEEPAEEKKEE